MYIFCPDMHESFTISLDKALGSLGHKLLLPEADVPIKYGKKWNISQVLNQKMSNTHTIGQQTLLDDPPDIFMIPCHEQEADCLKIYDKIKDKCKLVHYAGNESVPYDFDKIKNIISADSLTLKKSEILNKNAIEYFPWIDYERFAFYKKESDNLVIRSYIKNYKTYFPKSYKFYEKIIENTSCVHESIEDADYSEIPELMINSIATLHIKESEGFGYTICESLACGRPVILNRDFAKGNTYLKWCVNEISAIFISTVTEYMEKVKRLVTDYAYRSELQLNSAYQIRKIIDNDEQTEKLGKFLDNLL